MLLRTRIRPVSRLMVLTAIIVATVLTVATSLQQRAQASGCGFGIESSSSGNTVGPSTTTSYTGVPGLLLFVTPSWAGVYDPHPLGVWYTGTAWDVYNEDLVAMPLGVNFHLTPKSAMTSSTLDIYIHTAYSSTITSFYTVLDDPLANNNPNAVINVTPNFMPSFVSDPHPVGVWYIDGRWVIYNEDLAAMPVNAAFNVMVHHAPVAGSAGGAVTHTSSSGSVVGDSTYVNKPTTGYFTVLQVTPNASPAGVFKAVHNHTIGVNYVSSLAKPWFIFNEDVAAMAISQGFNVFWQHC